MEQEIQNILELIQEYKTEKHSRKCREILGVIEEKLNNICQCKETNYIGEEINETCRTETSNGNIEGAETSDFPPSE